MITTEHLIAQLAEDAPSSRPAAHPLHLFARWCAGSLLYVTILLLFFGLRPDLASRLLSPGFMMEIILLAGITITTGISAALLSFPDMYQKRWALWIPLLPLGLLIVLLSSQWSDNGFYPQPPHGLICLLCISLYALVPAIWMISLLRKQASTHYYFTGSLALLAASSAGCLALRLSEKTDSISHLVTWHYLPIFGFTILGLFLGQKFLKW